jgi:hypothetical protein
MGEQEGGGKEGRKGSIMSGRKKEKGRRIKEEGEGEGKGIKMD